MRTSIPWMKKKGSSQLGTDAEGKSVHDSNTGKPILRKIQRLRRSQLPIDTVNLARYLIGKTLVHDHPTGRMSGRIVETEAYPFGDAAGHSYRGETPANRSLFLGRGYAHVYFIYGSSFMMNITSEKPGVGAGVLLRAIEPVEGIALMKSGSSATRVLDITRGPGRLTRAMLINKRHDGADLCSPGKLWLGTAVRPVGPIANTMRIGITKEVQRKLRFYEIGNPYVSGPKHLRS